MECFYHEGHPAVGSCRACFKGLCRRCAAELEGGLACTGRCESMVEAVVASIAQSARYQAVSSGLLGSARGLWLGLCLVALFVGGFVILWGLMLPYYREVALLGVPFLALAFLSGRLARSVSASPASTKPAA
jgi:Flp pilus assembly protein TadB